MRLSFIRIFAFAGALCFYAVQTNAQEDQKDAAVNAGEALFNKRCAQCHSLAEGKNGNGPSLFGIIGRAAATEPGFKYSRALRQMAADESLTWNEDNLAAFLARPSHLVPGTRMAFPGISKAENVTALLDWIKASSGPPSGKP